MQRATFALAAVLLLGQAFAPAVHADPLRFQYLSPLPGSRLVSPANNVILRHGSLIDPASLASGVVSVTGTLSGTHSGRLHLSDDGRTVVFLPDVPFALGETVNVSAAGLRSLAGQAIPKVDFDFQVARRFLDQRRIEPLLIPRELHGASLAPALPLEPTRVAAQACDTLPPNYTPVTVVTSNDPAPAFYFLSPFAGASPRTANLTIVDERGMPVFYRFLEAQTRAHDFKKQQGLYTYWAEPARKYYAMDSEYTVVDSFTTGNGLLPDSHGFQLLPNGHALLQIYEGMIVDMSQEVQGGNPEAWVIGFTVQEIDASGTVVFQWRGFDHYDYTDGVSPSVSLTDSVIDYAHGNAIELDTDGNLLLSIRHFNEITKVSRTTGNIVWRLGLNAANNDFTFINDPRGFSHQHDIRRIANGNITMFDNGNFLDTLYSRAIEYDLDEVGMTATKVWEFRNSPDTYGAFMGSAQRLADGGTVIGWGGTNAPNVTHLRGDGTKALEFQLTPNGKWSYRAFRFPWSSGRMSGSEDSLDFGAIDIFQTASLPLTIRNIWSAPLEITCFATTDSSFHVDDAVPFTIPAGDSVTVNVNFSPILDGAYSDKLYVRSVTSEELHAQPVFLNATANAIVSVPLPDLRFALHAPVPNPFTSTARIGFALPEAAHVRLDVFDVKGRRVAKLVDGPRRAGSHTEAWRPGSLGAGLYFLRLEAGARAATQRIIHIP